MRNNTLEKLKPLFIIGHPKSGTTLLTALLDSHPELLVLTEESDYFNGIWPRVRLINMAWRLTGVQKSELLLNSIKERSHLRNYFKGKVDNDLSGNLDYREFDHQRFSELLLREFAQAKRFERRDTLLTIIRSFAHALNKSLDRGEVKYWVEKTPKNTWYVEEILNDFPDAKFIFIYRDPRDNYVSYKKKWDSHQNALKFSKSWNEAFENLQNLGEKLLKVRYEDLVQNTTKEMTEVTKFLGVKYVPSLNSPTKLGNVWKGNSMFKLRRSSVDRSSLGRYSKYISQEDLIVIEAFCGENMLKYGYHRDLEDKIEYQKIRRNLGKLYKAEPSHVANLVSIRRLLSQFRIRLTGQLK